jgi:hypothetical protein
MIYLAQFRYGSRLEGTGGEFCFIAEASSQEKAEMKIVSLLKGAVQNEKWFPAPCGIFLARLAVMDAIPSSGLAFHQRLARLSFLGGDGVDTFPMKYLPPHGIKVLFDWDKLDWSKANPVPLVFVERDRSLSFPTENVPPALW